MNVEILGKEYKVKVCKLDQTLHGDCDTEKKVIRINKNKGNGNLNDTFVHEVIHAILHESGVVQLLHQVDGLEEAVVRAIEHGLRSADLIPERL